VCPFSKGSWVHIEHNLTYRPRPTSVPSDILIHAAIWPQQICTENWGERCPFRGGGGGSPSNTVWPGPRHTCMPSFILWPRSPISATAELLCNLQVHWTAYTLCIRQSSSFTVSLEARMRIPTLSVGVCCIVSWWEQTDFRVGFVPPSGAYKNTALYNIIP